MNNKNTNMDQSREKDPLDVYSTASVKWNKSSDELWSGMQDKIEDQGKDYSLKPVRHIFRYAVAATLLILLGIPSLMRYYTKTIECGKAEHLDVVLPDGSALALNAETTVKYHPMWWRFKRDVKLDGEAYFEVLPGNSFVVESEMASTAVLGTSFNIISRSDRYEVTCLTGKVKVYAADSNSEVFITPNEKALMGSSGELRIESNIEAGETILWTDNEFFFTSMDLGTVLEEIERQYDVNIFFDISESLVYTGNFSRNQDIETILDLVCLPFGIKFEKTRQGTYLLTKDEQ
jgi:transmembrane sensor